MAYIPADIACNSGLHVVDGRSSPLPVAVTVFSSVLVPSWITSEILGFSSHDAAVRWNRRVGSILRASPPFVFLVRLVLIDWAILSLFIIHMCSDWGHQGFSWSVPLRAYGEWFVPYVAGRIAAPTRRGRPSSVAIGGRRHYLAERRLDRFRG